MRKFHRALRGVVATAILAAAALTGAARKCSAQEKQSKPGEFEVSNEVVKDIQAKDFNKAITDLDIWTQKFPETDYKDDRTLDYELAYASANPPQPLKALDYAAQLMDKDLAAAFKGQAQIPISIYYTAILAAGSLPNPAPEQLAMGDKAAHKLIDYAETYFVDANKPAATDAAGWAQARNAVQQAAKDYLFHEEILPGNQAMAKNDCAAAEVAYAKALTDYPQNTQISKVLGDAYRCDKKDLQNLYEYVRTAVIDPTVGGTAKDPKQIVDYAKKRYVVYHGSDEGYDQFQQLAKQNPLPPPDLKLETASDAAERKEKEFETSHPDIALWMKLKATLTSEQGQQYFEGSMKDAQVPELKGTVVESKCRAKELLVAVPLPDATGPLVPEIALKLATPLAGKVESGVVTFTGVASALSRDPFLLTMTIDKKDIKDLKITPCAAPAAKKGVTKKKY